MNITALFRSKRHDIQSPEPEAINTNFDAICQDGQALATALNAYYISLSADVTGTLPLANLTGGTSAYVLTGNGAGVAPSFQAVAAAPYVRIAGGTAALGKRVSWAQYAGEASSAMASVGTPAVAVTGGASVKDNDGYWAQPQSIAGGGCSFSYAKVFTRFNLLPKLIVRLRTPATITSWRFSVGMNEAMGGVNTDTPSTVNQRGIYVRYSTAIPDGGWVVQTVDGTARSTSATVLAIAASTIYVITITTNSTTSVTVDINGTSITVTANIVLAVDIGPDIHAHDLNGALTTQFDLQSVFLESN